MCNWWQFVSIIFYLFHSVSIKPRCRELYNVTFWSLVATWRRFCSNRACHGMEKVPMANRVVLVSAEGCTGREVETHHTDEPFKLLIPQNHVPVRILTYTRHHSTRLPLLPPFSPTTPNMCHYTRLTSATQRLSLKVSLKHP